VAIEVHLPVATGAEQERLAVLAHAVETELAVHLDDRLALAVKRHRPHVVLFVAVLVPMVKEPVARRIPLEPGADRARDLAVAQLLSVPVARIEEVELVSAGHVVVEGYRLAVGDTRGLAIVGREASSRSTSASSVSDIRSQTASVSPLKFPGRANVFTVMCCIVVCATERRCDGQAR